MGRKAVTLRAANAVLDLGFLLNFPDHGDFGKEARALVNSALAVSKVFSMPIFRQISKFDQPGNIMNGKKLI